MKSYLFHLINLEKFTLFKNYFVYIFSLIYVGPCTISPKYYNTSFKKGMDHPSRYASKSTWTTTLKEEKYFNHKGITER